jgi:hypothetical protein
MIIKDQASAGQDILTEQIECFFYENDRGTVVIIIDSDFLLVHRDSDVSKESLA